MAYPLPVIHPVLLMIINGLGAFALHECTDWITSFLPCFTSVADSRLCFMKAKLVNSAKQLDSSWQRLCWWTEWLADKLSLSRSAQGWLSSLTSYLNRQNPVILKQVVHRAVHHTYHIRNVLPALHWGSPQYHIRASTIGLKYQRQEDTSVLSGGSNSRSQQHGE